LYKSYYQLKLVKESDILLIIQLFIRDDTLS